MPDRASAAESPDRASLTAGTTDTPGADAHPGDDTGRNPAAGGPAWRTVLRTVLGRRADWRLVRPRLSMPHPTAAWAGTSLVVASVLVSWFAFASAEGDGPVAFGLFVGAAAILLMSWSFVLAVRIRRLEPAFGGLDRMYRLHRWTGSLAVVAMFLHIRVEPEIDGGIRGAGESMAEFAEELAGLGELALYLLVGISLVRWFPYRWWRLTHKLLGIPFVFACFHFVTAEKPYANSSAWGWWFGAWMVAGIVAHLWRVVVRDAAAPGRRYRVVSVQIASNATELRLAPMDGEGLGQRTGQFAFVKVQLPGLREPHPFTIASAPGRTQLRFLIRGLGDWSSRLQVAPLMGADVIVEGPYGRFQPLAGQLPHLWIAGGVGITPFLAAVDGLGQLDGPARTNRPTVVYCVRSRAEAMAHDELAAADADGRIRLSFHVSDEGTRLDARSLAAVVGRRDLRGVRVAVCGPDALVHAVVEAGRQLHASEVHTEDFDIRQGFGPDLSVPIDGLIRR